MWISVLKYDQAKSRIPLYANSFTYLITFEHICIRYRLCRSHSEISAHLFQQLRDWCVHDVLTLQPLGERMHGGIQDLLQHVIPFFAATLSSSVKFCVCVCAPVRDFCINFFLNSLILILKTTVLSLIVCSMRGLRAKGLALAALYARACLCLKVNVFRNGHHTDGREVVLDEDKMTFSGTSVFALLPPSLPPLLRVSSLCIGWLEHMFAVHAIVIGFEY